METFKLLDRLSILFVTSPLTWVNLSYQSHHTHTTIHFVGKILEGNHLSAPKRQWRDRRWHLGPCDSPPYDICSTSVLTFFLPHQRPIFSAVLPLPTVTCSWLLHGQIFNLLLSLSPSSGGAGTGFTLKGWASMVPKMPCSYPGPGSRQGQGEGQNQMCSQGWAQAVQRGLAEGMRSFTTEVSIVIIIIQAIWLPLWFFLIPTV